MKNPDGTITTRTANGPKRPNIKRCQSTKTEIKPLTRTNDFKSTIYCSKSCADQDSGRSSTAYDAIARSLSYSYVNGYPTPHALEPIQTANLKNPFAPPSPLFMESDIDSPVAAASAPRMEYFRMTRENPDDAWRERERQRRSSMVGPHSHSHSHSHSHNTHQHPTSASASTPMGRQKSHQSSSTSSDSLTSIWQEDSFARSTSGPGYLRAMTPFHRDRASFSSDVSDPITRPLPRSNLSQTSLASSFSKSIPIPAEFGSAPIHTLNLLQSYATAFPVRDSCGSRRDSATSSMGMGGGAGGGGGIGGGMRDVRSGTGTIKAKPQTWDALGKSIGREKSISTIDNTPKQSLEVENGRWQIRYTSPSPHTTSSSTSDPEDRERGIPIRSHPLLGTSASALSTSNAKTPRRLSSCMPPPPDRPVSAIPLLPVNQDRQVEASTGQKRNGSGSIPKAGWDWAELEKKGGKTYPLPKGITPGKSGLFYFQ